MVVGLSISGLEQFRPTTIQTDIKYTFCQLTQQEAKLSQGSRPYRATAPLRVTWVTWHHRSRDHFIVHMSFPIGCPLERSLYLQPFSRYCTLCVLRSRVWPFKVTWRHRSRYHLKAHMPHPHPFPIGAPLEFGTKPLYLTVSDIFNDACNAKVDMTLIRPLNKGQVHSFRTNRFLIYDFL